MWLFKVSGMFLIFAVRTASGFLKSSALKKRAEKLLSFSRSAAELGERIRSGGGEIKELLTVCFSEGLLKFGGDGYSVDDSFLKQEDTALIEEFFGVLGMSDAYAEYERTLAYSELIKARQELADAEYRQQSRLYRSLGFLSGIFICIFFL